MKTRRLDIFVNGNIIKKDFEVPEFWSDRAARIVAEKYAMDSENSVISIIDRVVNQITTWGLEQGYFDDDPDCSIESKFSNDLKDILIKQRASFNSPVWFNCNVPYRDNQMSACFILPIEDSMESILNHYSVEGNIFKGGSGAGANISKLRSKGEPLSGGGSSSGPISFMRGWDNSAGTIKSGGTTRRAAKLICMDVDHPDIEEFIECKTHEERKAKSLIKSGVSTEEAYLTVDFQNTNHSIRVTNSFMEAVSKDSDWNLINRTDGSVAKTVKARDLLMKAAEMAWETGDPGIQYHDRMNLDNPVPSLGSILSTNPCSEFSAINSSSCNLASLNLMKYYVEGAWFDWDEFGKDITVLITAMDILIDGADYPTEEIRKVTTETRPLGLGFSNLGAFLMTKGIKYDSAEANEFASALTKYMTEIAFRQSIELGKRLGSFKHFEDNKTICSEIVQRLTGKAFGPNDITHLRNSQVTLLAPTGTVSFMMDCDTSGIEPLPYKNMVKTLVGGERIIIEPKCVSECPNSEAIQTSYDINPVSWEGHLNMMAACQKHLSGAISKTVGMSSDSTPEDIFNAYVKGHELGLKAVAVYRDGAKAMQPLTSSENNKSVPLGKVIEKSTPSRVKLPDERKSITHKFTIGGHEGYITVGMYDDGSPGELFLKVQKEGSTLSGMMDSLGVAISLGLQYGIPLEHMVKKFKGTKFQPSGFTNNEDIRFADSMTDYIFKWLELKFLSPNGVEVVEDNSLDYGGPPCTDCGGLTIKQGTCFVCTECGSTSGCS